MSNSNPTHRDSAGHDALIRDLTEDLAPVKPLAPPLARAFIWIAAVVAFAVAGALATDLQALGHRLIAEPDMWLAVAGSALTALLAAVAAFQLCLPDRSASWALLPLPSALLWIVASGAGCLRAFRIADTRPPTISDERDCLLIILALSIPLSLLLLAMLRRGHTLLPGLTTLTAGLAAASAAATLLMFFHPFDATLSDLIAHGVGVVIVVAAVRYFGGRAFARKNSLMGA
jgi:hypothetical protein